MRNFEHEGVAKVQITTQLGGRRVRNFELEFALEGFVHNVTTLISQEMDSGLLSWFQVVQCHFVTSGCRSRGSGPVEIDDEDIVARLADIPEPTIA